MSTDTKSPQTLTLGKRVCLGFGGIPDIGMQVPIKSMANPIFNIVFGVNPALIGIAMALPRIWEIIIDPWIGLMSDRTRSRWGRRRPYVLLGGIIGALLFAAVWWVPESWSVTAKGWWLIAMAMLHFTAFSFFIVPYSALLSEATDNPVERTKIMAMRSAFVSITSGLIAWLYWLCQRPFFDDAAQGMRVVGIAFGLVMVIGALMPCLAARNHAGGVADIAPPKKGDSLKLFRELLRIAPFRGVLLAIFAVVTCSSLTGNFGFYVTVFYMYAGDKVSAALLLGVSGAVLCVANVLVSFAVGWMRGRVGAWKTLRFFIATAFLGYLSQWWTMRPEWPYVYVITAIMCGMGITSFWIIMSSLTGEISADYERRTGRALAGSFFAFFNIAIKLAFSVGLLLTGFLLNATGFDIAIGDIQGESTLTAMRLLNVIGPCAGLLVAWRCVSTIKRGTGKPND